MDQIIFVVDFMWQNFLQIWPLLLVTIPLAVAVNLSGASRYIRRAFQAGPLLAIVLATLVGAFSPFCSCSVIPVVASLLVGGVPLAPVMAFWIASPSMDPEIFFLSVGMIGWELALWRLGGTLVLSLGAGLITHVVTERGWLGSAVLRGGGRSSVRSRRAILREGWQTLKTRVTVAFSPAPANFALARETLAPASIPVGMAPVQAPAASGAAGCGTGEGATCGLRQPTFRQRLWQETVSATRMVLQFMALAFFLEALIILFVPETWIAGLLGEQNRWAVPLAALLGVPVYTSNLAALPLVGGLLEQGMNPAAALAFLIAGPTTTLPAMAAVWGLVQRRVFALYVAFALVGAVLLGLLYGLFTG